MIHDWLVFGGSSCRQASARSTSIADALLIPRGRPPLSPLISCGADLRELPLSKRRRRLQAILPTKSPSISEALSVKGRGRELFELMCSNDLEGIVAKRLDDRYEARVRWLKIKNRDYSQAEGRGDLFNGPRQPAGWR